MSKYEEDSSEETAEDANTQAAAISGELAEQSEGEFVIETPKSNHNAVLMLLALLVAGGGALYLMHLKAGPATAIAATPESITAKATISEFLTDGGKNIQTMRDLLRNTEKVVQQFTAYPSMTQIRLEELKSNPFRFADAKVEKPAEDLEKQRLAREQEALRLKEQRKQEVAKAAGQLQVQSIISGQSRTCMIGNQPYTEGQQVGGFTIEKIAANSVIVKREGYRFELRMQQN